MSGSGHAQFCLFSLCDVTTNACPAPHCSGLHALFKGKEISLF